MSILVDKESDVLIHRGESERYGSLVKTNERLVGTGPVLFAPVDLNASGLVDMTAVEVPAGRDERVVKTADGAA